MPEKIKLKAFTIEIPAWLIIGFTMVDVDLDANVVVVVVVEVVVVQVHEEVVVDVVVEGVSIVDRGETKDRISAS